MFELFDMIGAAVIGALITVMAFIVLGGTYPDGIQDAQKEAVAAKHAEWIIETNESGEPEMKFQWKQLK